MGRMNRDTGVAIFLLLFCGVFFAATFDIRETSYGTPGAGVWPRIILLALALLSAGYLAQSLKRGPRARQDVGRGLRGWFATYRNALWCYFLFAAFLLTMPYLGMLLGVRAYCSSFARSRRWAGAPSRAVPRRGWLGRAFWRENPIRRRTRVMLEGW